MTAARVYWGLVLGWAWGMAVALFVSEWMNPTAVVALLVGFALSFVGMMAGGLWAARRAQP